MNITTRKAQGGFTLIELVIIIVILGILAAVAIPRYVNLEDQATTAACDGVEGAILSAAAITVAENRGVGTSAQINDNLVVGGGVTANVADCSATFTVNNGSACDDNSPVDLAAIGLCDDG